MLSQKHNYVYLLSNVRATFEPLACKGLVIEWRLIYVAFCTIMAILRRKEARSQDALLLSKQGTSRLLPKVTISFSNEKNKMFFCWKSAQQDKILIVLQTVIWRLVILTLNPLNLFVTMLSMWNVLHIMHCHKKNDRIYSKRKCMVLIAI